MGMFDYVKVSIDKLPITDEEKKLLKSDTGFQTKSFECIMTEIRITDGGDLEIDLFEYGFDPEAKNLLGTKGALYRKNERTEKIPFHGFFNFYTHNKKEEWIEFSAKFTDGKLQSITKVD